MSFPCEGHESVLAFLASAAAVELPRFQHKRESKTHGVLCYRENSKEYTFTEKKKISWEILEGINGHHVPGICFLAFKHQLKKR